MNLRVSRLDRTDRSERSNQLSCRGISALLIVLALVFVSQSGCQPAGGAPTKITNHAAASDAQWSEDLFTFALENLNHLEDNDCEEMLRTTQQRIAVLGNPKVAPGVLPPDNLLASWPEPDMLRQVVSRLNQWVDTQAKPDAWKPDPMLATLPADLAGLPMLKNVGDAHFTAYDGYMLMEAVWLRDAARSKWAGGSSADGFRVAGSIFDWTIRNIQADDDSIDRVPQVPWETLFLGHGTTWERAWTYILLLRQRGIDAALLALPEDSSPETKPAKQALKPWCVGVLIGDKEKKVYLFDPTLGLPIPAPQGITADKLGGLDVQPATLDQVVADPELLDRLSLADAPYWARKADLKHVVALLEASPLYLSPRAKRIEARLTGEQRLVLNAEPTQQAARWRAAGVGEVRLWELPYTTLQRRLALSAEAVIERLLAYEPFMSSPLAPLYKGRMIMQLKGRFFDEREAVAYYQRARPRNDTVLEEAGQMVKSCFDYLSQQQRKASGRAPTPAEENALKRMAAGLGQQQVAATIQGKLDASYWLGLIEFEQGEFASALEYFRIRTLQFGPNVFWAAGAHYNIGRSLEASGQRQEAIGAYESSLMRRDESGKIVLMSDPGSLVRAHWLAELAGDTKKQADEKKPGK